MEPRSKFIILLIKVFEKYADEKETLPSTRRLLLSLCQILKQINQGEMGEDVIWNEILGTYLVKLFLYEPTRTVPKFVDHHFDFEKYKSRVKMCCVFGIETFCKVKMLKHDFENNGYVWIHLDKFALYWLN